MQKEEHRLIHHKPGYVATTTTTVTIITILLERGYWRILRRESQLNVPIDTIIMTATSAANGMA